MTVQEILGDGPPPKRKRDVGVDDLVLVMFKPVIADSMWVKSLPDWIFEAIRVARLAQVRKGEKGFATLEECVAYLFTASLKAMLSSMFTDIYLYVMTQVMSARGTEIPEDIRVDELSEYYLSNLNDLRRKIWNSAERVGKARLREAERSRKEEEEAKLPKQVSLFAGE